MNKFLLASLIMVITVFCVSTASAAVTVTTTIDKDNPVFGGPSQIASNPNAEETEDENIYVLGDVTLNSTTVATITDISVTPLISGITNDDLKITLNDSDLTLAVGVAEAITLRARIPEELDAVDNDGNAEAFQVADAVLTLSDSSTVTIPIWMQRENHLEIDKILVSKNGGTSKSYSSTDKTVDVERIDSIEVSVKLENTYDKDDGDLEIEDIEITASFDDEDIADDEDDVDDIEEDASTLDEEESSDIIELTSFKVHEEAENDYDAEIYVIGDDEHGARHGERWDITFNVEVESHDMRITKATLSQNNISCDRTTTLTVKGINIGKGDEEDVMLTVINSDLSLSEYKEYDEIEADEDDNDFSASFAITAADSVNAGIYPLNLKLYRDNDDLEYAYTINLVVKACIPSTTTTSDASTTVVSSSTTTSDTSTTTSSDDEDEETGTSTETSFFESPAYNGLLIGVNVIAIIAVIAVAIIFLKPKP